MKIMVQSLLFLLFSVALSAQSTKIFDQKIKIYSAEIYFDFARYAIRSDADSTLQLMLQYLSNREGSFSLEITAHTDFVGTNENNSLLSQNRADAVKEYLVAAGLAAETIEVDIFGEEQPQASNETDQGRALNRRATIVVFETKKMLDFNAQIVDEESGVPVAADVIIRTKTSRDSLRSDEEGKFNFPLPLNTVVGIDIYSKCYFLKTKMFKVNPKHLANLKFKLQRAKAGKISTIDNLYFVGNKDTLLQKSEPELPKILKFMQINDCLKIQIAGHVNVPNSPKVSVASPEFNLSTRRAKRVFDYLVEHGISEKRIAYQGYGNWEMRYPNARSEKQQAQNRRVEIRVLEEEEKEACLCKNL